MKDYVIIQSLDLKKLLREYIHILDIIIILYLS